MLRSESKWQYYIPRNNISSDSKSQMDFLQLQSYTKFGFYSRQMLRHVSIDFLLQPQSIQTLYLFLKQNKQFSDQFSIRAMFPFTTIWFALWKLNHFSHERGQFKIYDLSKRAQAVVFCFVQFSFWINRIDAVAKWFRECFCEKSGKYWGKKNDWKSKNVFFFLKNCVFLCRYIHLHHLLNSQSICCHQLLISALNRQLNFVCGIIRFHSSLFHRWFYISMQVNWFDRRDLIIYQKHRSRVILLHYTINIICFAKTIFQAF